MTVCLSASNGLYADDNGLTLRKWLRRERQFAWSEVSHFADGIYNMDMEHRPEWRLAVVLRTGKKVHVARRGAVATSELLDTLRQVSQRYGVPADVTGVPARNGGQRPATRGLYADPGGQAGLRFWDGRQWSPLLPPDIGTSRAQKKGPSAWSDLPTATGRWTYAAARATRLTVGIAVCAALSAALVPTALAALLWWDRVSQHGHLKGFWVYWFIISCSAPLWAAGFWQQRKVLPEAR
jgi:hypothetical protein